MQLILRLRRLSTALLCATALAGCLSLPTRTDTPTAGTAAAPLATACPPVVVPPPPSCPACPACPGVEPPKPVAKALQTARWSDLPGWRDDSLRVAFEAFVASCPRLAKQTLWQSVCASARDLPAADLANAESLRGWFETQFQPWAMTNPDSSSTGLITGYYEPLINGSRQRSGRAGVPVFGPPEDLVVVELSELYPELKHMRLRGRLEGRKLVPYYSRAEWESQESKRSPLLWVEDPIDFFFLQIQGSGQVRLPDGGRVRLNYADQNGHPYRSIGKWLIDQGELKPNEASMQGIKNWVKANPKRRAELLNANPSVVFFRELPVEGSGPPGALAAPLTPERSIAVDPRHISLGAPVWLATTRPNSEQALTRLMLAQDTGGAIRGPVRADFYWGTGDEAGALAGRMRQQGRLWVLLPRGHRPENAEPDAPR
jgi:membrane-bound lytic murein transglycosylase A